MHWGGSLSSSFCSSSRFWRLRTSTSGARGHLNGGEAPPRLRAELRAAALADEGPGRLRAGARRRRARVEAQADHAGEGGRLVADEVDVARPVRPLVLR